MNSYYQSMMEDLHCLLEKGELDQARAIVKDELSMPYIPVDVQNALEQIRTEIMTPAAQAASGLSVDKIRRLAAGSIEQKATACRMLDSLNLRQCEDLVQSLLDEPTLPDEARSALITSLMEQRVEDPFHIKKNGTDVEFVPTLIVPPEQDPVLKETDRLLQQWLASDDPVLYNFASELERMEVEAAMPFDFDGVDPTDLAAALVHTVFESLQDEEGWKAFARKHSLETVREYPLLIKKQGEN